MDIADPRQRHVNEILMVGVSRSLHFFAQEAAGPATDGSFERTPATCPFGSTSSLDILVHRIKPVLVIGWIALVVVAAMHSSFEMLGDFANDFCCWATAAALHHPGTAANANGANELSARRSTGQPGNPARVAMTDVSFPRAMRRPSVEIINPPATDGEACFLLRNWHFRTRAASAPRAPSALA